MPNTYTEKSKSKTRPKINFQTDEDSKRENSLSIIKKWTKVADTNGEIDHWLDMG